MFSLLRPAKLVTTEQQIWFVADCHFNHNQPFIYHKRYGLDSVESYNEYLIDVWNTGVKPNDIVFDLGDFIFQDGTGAKAWSILSRLNGQHYLMWGNHNSGIKSVFNEQVHYPYTVLDKVHFIGHYAEIIVNKQPIVLCHYPLAVWNDNSHGTWMIHGHSHGTFNDAQFGKIADVGIDVFGRPVSFDEIKVIMDSRSIVQLDQHDEDTNRSGW